MHVSTAYINANRNYAAEKIYELSIQPSKLLDAVEWMDDEMFDILTKKLINDRPNTYTYSKALAEHLISEEANGIPLAIIRPSIVTSAWREPLPVRDSCTGFTSCISRSSFFVEHTALLN